MTDTVAGKKGGKGGGGGKSEGKQYGSTHLINIDKKVKKVKG